MFSLKNLARKGLSPGGPDRKLSPIPTLPCLIIIIPTLPLAIRSTTAFRLLPWTQQQNKLEHETNKLTHNHYQNATLSNLQPKLMHSLIKLFLNKPSSE